MLKDKRIAKGGFQARGSLGGVGELKFYHPGMCSGVKPYLTERKMVGTEY